ncbi:hypothetical protein SUDANB54_06834 [Streptomyces sp. enrichment culture]
MRSLSCHGLKCRAWERTWMVKAMSEENETIGAVSQSRYEQIVAELRDVVEQQTRGQFTIGDRALEVEPMRQRGGETGDSEYTVEESLTRLAEDIGLRFSTVKTARWVASRWPKERRRPELASYTVHRSLASIEDEERRFATILTLPEGKAAGPRTTPIDRSASRSRRPSPRRRRLPRSTRWPGTPRSRLR